MKKLVAILPLCVVAVALGLSGCSKSKTGATSSGNGGNGSDATTASVASDQPVDMRINWTVGRKYPMRMELDQTTKTDVPNQPQPVVQEVKISQGFEMSVLKPLDNGGRQLELQFQSQTMDVSQGDHSVLSFNSLQDSAQDTNDPVTPVLRAMIGARVQYFTDANGKVERVEGTDALTKRFAASGSPQAQAVLQQMFSEETLKRYGSFADAMPGHVVKVGDRWPLKEDVTTSIGVVTVDLTYTFRNWEQHHNRNCAHVVAEGELTTKTTSTATGMVVEIKKGTITGDFWYDPVLGMIVEVNNDQDLALKITTRAQTLTSQFNQSVRLALVEAE
ncbi:MAG TPA: DUF6263 family protein [Verrucomicrobiae bacterium]|nr:DUF6263 family protein [Verrucomicrobiae bacterium]